SMATFEAEVGRRQAENDQLPRALANIDEQIVCDQLTDELPDNFLEQFNQLLDRPLEQVLHLLPAHQVAQMRLVSRRFNHLIRKCSKTMPKKEHNGSISFKSYDIGEVSAELLDDRGRGITKTTLTGNKGALSELLRFIRIGGKMYFSHGLSAVDEVLDQLCKAWLTIRPEVVIFSGDLSQTSRKSLKAFLVNVEPSIRRLHFQEAYNIPHNLLSDDLIGAAGWLDGLIVLPMGRGSNLPNFNITDKSLLTMADADLGSSYFCVMGCSGITPGCIRAFIQKWMKKEKPKAGANSTGYRYGDKWDRCTLAFYKCANVTPAAVEESCGDLFKKK
uniref:F-box domain-containing protein n=1 Tax=Plectus sambesii TaxID=2011161 RepID=A0A914V816_9BILA